MAVSIDLAHALTEQFIQNYPNLTNKLGFLFRERQEDIYKPTDYPIKGALVFEKTYLNNGLILHATVDAVLNNADSPNDFIKTLNHEILGHYALNAIPIYQKNMILSQLKNTQAQSEFKAVWDQVKLDYPNAPPDLLAEEVYCKQAEVLTPELSKNYSRVKENGIKSFQEVCLHKQRPMNKEDLNHITCLNIQFVQDCNIKKITLPGIEAIYNQHTKEIVR